MSQISLSPYNKIALVLGGGAIKAGAFHLGVALALRKHGFSFQTGLNISGSKLVQKPYEISIYVGSSAGAFIISLMSAGYSFESILDTFLGKSSTFQKLNYKKIFHFRREHLLTQSKGLKERLELLFRKEWKEFFCFKGLQWNAMFSTSGIETYLREHILPSNRFQDYLPELYISATQLNTAKKIVFGKRQLIPSEVECEYEIQADISHACAASMALPFIFYPYAMAGQDQNIYHYVDAEVKEPLSPHIALDAGADLVIASYIHHPLKSELDFLIKKGLPAILVQSFYISMEQKIRKQIQIQRDHQKAISEVLNYCKKQGISKKDQNEIEEILEKRLQTRLNTRIIEIHPESLDQQVFLSRHFSLSPKKLAQVVDCGFQAAQRILAQYRLDG